METTLHGIKELIDAGIEWMNENDLFWHQVQVANVRAHLRYLIQDAERLVAYYSADPGAQSKARVSELWAFIDGASRLDKALDNYLNDIAWALPQQLKQALQRLVNRVWDSVEAVVNTQDALEWGQIEATHLRTELSAAIEAAQGMIYSPDGVLLDDVLRAAVDAGAILDRRIEDVARGLRVTTAQEKWEELDELVEQAHWLVSANLQQVNQSAHRLEALQVRAALFATIIGAGAALQSAEGATKGLLEEALSQAETIKRALDAQLDELFGRNRDEK